jgi:hypothetical protein
MGIYYDTVKRVGVRILQHVGDAWFVVKEYIGPDFQQAWEGEYKNFVGNPEFRVEWAHSASTTHDPIAMSDTMVIWKE